MFDADVLEAITPLRIEGTVVDSSEVTAMFRQEIAPILKGMAIFPSFVGVRFFLLLVEGRTTMTACPVFLERLDEGGVDAVQKPTYNANVLDPLLLTLIRTDIHAPKMAVSTHASMAALRPQEPKTPPYVTFVVDIYPSCMIVHRLGAITNGIPSTTYPQPQPVRFSIFPNPPATGHARMEHCQELLRCMEASHLPTTRFVPNHAQRIIVSLD